MSCRTGCVRANWSLLKAKYSGRKFQYWNVVVGRWSGVKPTSSHYPYCEFFYCAAQKGIQVYVPLRSGDACPNAGAIIPPWLCPGWQRIGAGKVFIDWSQKTSSEKRSWSEETSAGSPWPMRVTNRSFSAGSVVPHPSLQTILHEAVSRTPKSVDTFEPPASPA